MTDKIIEFKPRKYDNSEKVIEKVRPKCKHSRVELDTSLDTIECNDREYSLYLIDEDCLVSWYSEDCLSMVRERDFSGLEVTK